MLSKKVACIGFQCVACGTCIKKCPRNAMEIKFGVKAYVDNEKCVGCGLCEKACPADIITVVDRGEAYE